MSAANLPAEGKPFPSFSLPDASGTRHGTKEHKGKWMVLYFYPKDDTPGCTIEACEFRDAWSDLKKAGIIVLGVSVNDAKDHQKFAAKHKLPFPLLVDEDNKLSTKLGVYGEKKFMGRAYMGILRTTFVISPDGRLAKVFEKVKPLGHAREVLNFINSSPRGA